MFALTVDIDEQRADLRQDRHRCRATVQSGAAAASGLDLSAENEQSIGGFDLELLEYP